MAVSLLMNDVPATTVLNRLLRILCRSLASYLHEARPWTRPEQQPAAAAITHLADDQQQYAVKVAALLQELGERAEPGSFPARFAAINDLGVEYLLRLVVEHHRCDVDQIAQCAAALAGDRRLGELAEEISGNARGHLEILEQMAKAG